MLPFGARGIYFAAVGRVRWGLVLLLSACATEMSPLSLDVHYVPDMARLPQAEAISSVKVGVARFTDARPRTIHDLHSASYVAHDGLYHLGLTWNGRTFAPAASVVQGLLVAELRRAGIDAVEVNAEVDADDAPGAQAAGTSCALVLGGVIHSLAFNRAGDPKFEPTFDVEITLFEMPSGKARMRAPFSESHQPGSDVPRQRRVDELLDRSFRAVAHQIAAELGREASSFVAAQQAAAVAAAAPPPPVVTEPVEPSPEPAAHHKHKRRR